METIEIIHGIHGSVEHDSNVKVRLYDMGERERDVIIEITNELMSMGAKSVYRLMINSGSSKYVAPSGYGLVMIGADIVEKNEKGKLVYRKKNIMAAFKL